MTPYANHRCLLQAGALLMVTALLPGCSATRPLMATPNLYVGAEPSDLYPELAPELGVKYAMENLKRAYTWDIEGRTGRLPPAGGELEIHEFDYKASNQVLDADEEVLRRDEVGV